MATRLWDVRDRLTSIYTELLAAESGVEVFDGPMRPSAAKKTWVIIGSDGGDDGGGGDEDGAVARQTASRLSPPWRDEAGEITCSVWSWGGDTSYVKHRATVSRIVDLCEASLVADRTLGGLLKPSDIAEFGDLRVLEFQAKSGAVVRAAFTVAYRTLITS